MQKQKTEDKSSQAEPGAAGALVDTGKSPEASPETAPPPGQAAHPREDGKKVKIAVPELETLKAKAAEAEKYYDQFLRARAEFDNYRKRVAQEKQYAELGANERVFQKLLGLLDNFELAVASAEKIEGAQAITDGLQMLQNQLQGLLRESGVEEFDALHQKFDPNFHEAIQQMESREHEEGIVIQQIRKGYKFKDRLLRPAAVIVSKKPEPPLPTATAEKKP